MLNPQLPGLGVPDPQTITDGGDSVIEFERWLEEGDPGILEAIADYNRDDWEPFNRHMARIEAARQAMKLS